jgi:hypothetical protein
MPTTPRKPRAAQVVEVGDETSEPEVVAPEADFYRSLVFVLEKKYQGAAILHAERELTREFHARPEVMVGIELAVADISARRFPGK